MKPEHNIKTIKCPCGYVYQLETDYNKGKDVKIECPNCKKILEYKKEDV